LKNPNKELRNSEQRYKILTENIQIGILLFDGVSMFYINPAVETILGYNLSEIRDFQMQDIISRDDMSQLLNASKKIFNNEINVFKTVVSLISKDSRKHVLELFMTKVQLDNKPNILITILDITELEKTRHSLAESNDFLNSLISSIYEVVFVHDLDDKYLMFRWPKREAQGWDFSSMIGKKMEDIVEDKERISLHKRMRKLAIESDHSITFTNRIGYEEGERWFEITFSPLHSSNNQIIGTVGVAKDITERIDASEKARFYELRLATIAESVSDIIFYVEQGKVTYISPSVKKILGFDPKDYKGRLVSDFIPLSIVVKASRTNGPYHFESNLSDTQGRKHALEFSVARIGNSYSGVARDATDRRIAEQAKRTFLHSIAHELRNPLTVVIGYSELLKSTTPPENENVHSMIDIILGAAKREQKRITELIGTDTIKTKYEIELFGAYSLFSGIFKKLDVFLKSLVKDVKDGAKLVYTWSVNDNLRDTRVNVDLDKIFEVFENLATNSVKYSQKDRIEINTNVILEERGLKVTFSDRGIGIPKSHMNKIFSPYFQVFESEKKDGVGLGLSIVKLSIETFGGTIEALSTIGEGTTFIITLPVQN